MATLEEYSSYKEKHFTLEVLKNVSDCIRIFLWTLVQKIQQDHLQNLCRVSICKDSISVKDNVAYLTAKKIDFTDKSANENYFQLLRFMKEDVFKDIECLPYSLNNFMILLGDPNPLQYQYLLGRHFGILPSRVRFQVLKDLIQRPLALPYKKRKKIFRVIDRVIIQENWEKRFLSQDSKKATAIEKYLEKNFKYTGSFYDTVCPACRTYYLLRLMRNCLLHLGFRRSAITALSGAEEEDAYHGFTLNILIQYFVELFPSEVTDILHSLHLKGVLKYLCINPSDRIIAKVSEEEIQEDKTKKRSKVSEEESKEEKAKKAANVYRVNPSDRIIEEERKEQKAKKRGKEEKGKKIERKEEERKVEKAKKIDKKEVKVKKRVKVSEEESKEEKGKKIERKEESESKRRRKRRRERK